MDEEHAPQFRGVWIPVEVLSLFHAGELSATDMLLLVTIDSLVAPGKGCYASNEYLGERTRRSVTKTSNAISRMKKTGLLRQVGFNGTRRFLETAWSRVGVEPYPEGQGSLNPRVKAHISSKVKTIMPVPPGPGLIGGFGLSGPPKNPTKGSPVTEFDIKTATELINASKKFLGPTHQRVNRLNPKKEGNQIRLLRVNDGATEDEITATLKWYTAHMTGPYAFKAYNADKFRYKFAAIKAAALKDVQREMKITPEAKFIIERLYMLNWPKDSRKDVPAMTQRCMDVYSDWKRSFYRKITKLSKAEDIKDRDQEYKLTVAFAEWVYPYLSAPDHFVQHYMEYVNEKTVSWQKWDGSLGTFVFNPNGDYLQNMGRDWSNQYMNKPGIWDRLMEILNSES